MFLTIWQTTNELHQFQYFSQHVQRQKPKYSTLTTPTLQSTEMRRQHLQFLEKNSQLHRLVRLTTKLFFCFQTHCWCWRFVDGFSPSSSDLLSQHCFKQRKLFTLTEGFWRPDSPGRRMRCGAVCLAFWWSCGQEWWTLLPSPSREDTSTVLMQHLQAPFSCVWAGDDKWERTHISPLRSSHSFWASNGFTSVSSSPSIRPRTESIVF